MFSKTCTGAFKASLFLAKQTATLSRWGAKEIATELAIPEPFMAKILQQLVRANLITSQKGPNGGFYMTEEQTQIKPIKIIEVFDGLHIFEKCVLDLPECSHENPYPLHNSYKQLKESMISRLTQSTMSDFV